MNKKTRTPSLDKNSLIMQSSILTEACMDMTRMEMQIFIILVAAAQQDLYELMDINREKGLPFGTLPEYGNSVQVAFSLDSFKDRMSRHEYELKTAAEGLVSRTIETRDEKGGWTVQPLIQKVEYRQEGRNVIMNISPDIWKRIMDVKLGFSEYELFTALELKSPYSVRMYMIVSGLVGTKKVSFHDLKRLFKLETMYEDNTNFMNRVVLKAQKELDNKAPLSFDAKPYKKEGSKGYAGVLITPKKNLARKGDAELANKTLISRNMTIGMCLDGEEIAWLKDHLYFDDGELNRNFETFSVAKKIFMDGLLDLLCSIHEFLIRNGRGGQKGTFIKTLKTHIQKARESKAPDEQ